MRAATSYPAALDIELTNVCNLRCPMCPRTMPGFRKHRKVVGHMSDKIFGRLCRELDRHKNEVNWAWLHVSGEPLLDADFVSRANRLREAIRSAGVSTNATVLTEQLARELLRSRLDRIIVSIDGVTKKTYERVRVGADFDDVMERVDMLLRLTRRAERKKRKHPSVWLQCLLMDDTKEEVEAFVRKYSDSEEPPTKFQSLKGIKGGRVFLKRHETYASQVKPRGFGWDGANGISGASGNGRRYSCTKPFNRTTILMDGSVSICCYDIQGRCIVGTLKENSLGGVWRSKAYQDIRRGFDEAQKQRRDGVEVDDNLFPELCRKC